MGEGHIAIIFLSALTASLVATRLVVAYLSERLPVDRPNERSSHTVPTPRGAGVATTFVLLVGWALVGLAFSPPPAGLWVVVACAITLAAISWLDDVRTMRARWRMLAHVVAVAVGTWAAAPDVGYFGGFLPYALDLAAAGFLWVWFVNLYNFMDGIDGITGVESAGIGLGVAACAIAAGSPAATVGLGIVVFATALGFLPFNWHPARVFMGDVGSVPLGYALGWLLLSVAGQGLWVAAILLPLYYLADASLTLARRLFRGERIWEAHREHYYQVAVQGGMSHGAVAIVVALLNVVLVVLAAASTGWLGDWVSLGCGAACVALVLTYFAFRARRVVPGEAP